jgi:undecaprenyl-diphosphatase
MIRRGRRLRAMEKRDEQFVMTAAAAALVCLIWLAASMTAGRTMAFDEAVRAAVHSAATTGLTRFMQLVTLLGSQAVMIGLSVCAAAALFAKGHWRRATFVLIAWGGAEALEFGLKLLFHRPRPSPFFDTPLPPSFSFPSGHALLSLSVFGALAALAGGWPARIAAIALALVIGASRVYLGVHYPTDVIAGFLAGAVWLAVAAVLHRRIATMKR